MNESLGMSVWLIIVFLKCVFKVLGVNPIEGFDMVKAVYAKKRKEAERNNDEATAARVGDGARLFSLYIKRRKKIVLLTS